MQCRTCLEDKDSDCFEKNRRQCKTCRTKVKSKRAVERYRNEEEIRNKQKIYKCSPKSRFSNSKANAKSRCLEWSIEYDDFCRLIEMPCVYCNDILEPDTSSGSGLDRIDNNKGYTLDNVSPCGFFCNHLRSDRLTVEETHAAIKAIIEVRISYTQQRFFAIAVI